MLNVNVIERRLIFIPTGAENKMVQKGKLLHIAITKIINYN